MALTREFKETVLELCKDAEYRKGLLLEALETYLKGDVPEGNALLRDYLNGTQAFAEVAARLEIQEASLRRMVGQKGNATAKNLFRLFKLCYDREGINPAYLRLQTDPIAAHNRLSLSDNEKSEIEAEAANKFHAYP